MERCYFVRPLSFLTTLSLLFLACCLLWNSPAQAEGMLLGVQKGQIHKLIAGSLSTVVEKQVATTVVEQEYQLLDDETDLFYGFSIPEKASVVNFELWQGKQWQAADIRSIEQPKLPAGMVSSLNQYLGANPFRITLKREGKICKLRLTFVELLPYKKGEVSYTYPLLRYKEGEYPDVALDIAIRLDRKLDKVEIPSHPHLRGSLTNDREWTLKAKLTNAEHSKNLQLLYRPVQDQISLRFLAHRDPQWEQSKDADAAMFRDGYFLLMLEPKEDVAADQIIPKTFTLVIDTSGSMSGDKIVQARNAALYCVEHLNDKDYFNVIEFSTGATRFRNQAVPASAENRQQARTFIESLVATGSTNISQALLEALQGVTFTSERPHLILFLTDGMPTAGLTGTPSIVDAVRKANTQQARIFAFGIGSDYNHALLEELAYATRGQASQLDPARISEILQQFFLSINSPILADLAISFGKAQIDKVTPSLTALPNVYLGSQLLVLGRYLSFEKQTIQITGKVGSKQVQYTVEAEFAREQKENNFLPRIWAMAYADDLYRRWIRESQPEDLKKTIQGIGLAYRIQTAFTSFGYTPTNPTDNSKTAYDPTNPSPYAPGGSYTGPVQGAAGGCACYSGSEQAPSLPLAILALIFLAFALRRRPRS